MKMSITTKYILCRDTGGEQNLALFKSGANIDLDGGVWFTTKMGESDVVAESDTCSKWPSIEDVTGQANWDIKPGDKIEIEVDTEITVHARKSK